METSLKPKWAGEDWLSQWVNRLIATQPLYALMKQQARQVLIKTAEKKGVPWRQSYEQLSQSTVRTLLPHLENSQIDYPDYYLKPFHAYDAGNLCWQAAFEAESATYAMALRIWPQEDLTWQAAQQRLRDSFHQCLHKFGPSQVEQILDLGCSVGLSTRSLHQFYQQRQGGGVTTRGLDLSPYMLAVAQHQDQHHEIADWIHAQAEQSGLADQSIDVVTLQFVLHELPQQAARDIFQEAYRILRPGGCLAIVDNDPQSPVIQGLPPVLFTLMKSTEPWSDEYYTFEVEAALAAAGFEQISKTASDPRHRTLIGLRGS
ncbi:class I SAM-dependent methyltransferase [Lyngbya confervoides]|uniref:Methyltransferase domain-containing protein n=1 Tax=Lyngbya confervoides BDU141951 TaxID=1574623 RepID=A0ABD4T1T3_9CYAN|nr:methyltransferase domain-containing protein [Lyngbya confervoides]MCM1982300.1 methyltransferase domain-containing protein [Lyngbya confervoides BDU141951]